MKLTGWGKLLLWDFERGSLAYDVVCVLLTLFVLLVRSAWLGDPMGPLP